MADAPLLPRPLPEAAAIAGRTVVLERVDPARHGRALWEAIGTHEDLWRGVPPGPFAAEAEFAKWLGDRATRPDQVLYALVDKESGVAEGLYLLINIDNAVGRIELGLMLGPELSRSTAATEAFHLISRHIFEDLAYRRLEWRCNPENQASMRAAERFGFTLEGVLRQNTWLKGRNWDTAVFSMLDREWPAVAARFQSWLAPGNFDGEGRQVRPLVRGR
jgi:RimJ/RimL family protein N-acetyltransferase